MMPESLRPASTQLQTGLQQAPKPTPSESPPGWYCSWVQIFRSKYSDKDFNLAEAQNIKISSKYQNTCAHQNVKIIAQSTPIFAKKAPKCSKFRNQILPENKIENASKPQILVKSFAPNFKIPKYFVIFLYFGQIPYFGISLVFAWPPSPVDLDFETRL